MDPDQKNAIRFGSLNPPFTKKLRQKLVNFLTPEQLNKWDTEVSKAKEFFGRQMG